MSADIRSFFGSQGVAPKPKQEKTTSGKEDEVSAIFIRLYFTGPDTCIVRFFFDQKAVLVVDHWTTKLPLRIILYIIWSVLINNFHRPRVRSHVEAMPVES